jgi:hypothetical protein
MTMNTEFGLTRTEMAVACFNVLGDWLKSQKSCRKCNYSSGWEGFEPEATTTRNMDANPYRETFDKSK